jgi:hypothetical protein
MAVSAVLLLRLVANGRSNGLPIIPYERDGARQPWQLALSARILAEVGGQEDADVIQPWRHSR